MNLVVLVLTNIVGWLVPKLYFFAFITVLYDHKSAIITHSLRIKTSS